MQPYLHIFSHFSFLPPSLPAKPLLTGDFRAPRRRPLQTRDDATPRAGARDETPLAELHPAPESGGGARIASPPPGWPAKGTDHLPSASDSSLPPRHNVTRARRARVTLFALATLLAAFAVALAGCGSSSPGGTAADPADAVPASAVLYAGATVRPEGAQKTNALAVGKALTHQADPYLRLLGALQTPGSAQLSFKRDVAPWLGPHAGVFLTSLGSSSALASLVVQGLLGGSTSGTFAFGAGSAQGAIVLDTSDSARARSFLDSQAAKAGAHATSYHGVSYELTAGGVAFGLIDSFAVIGSEAGLRGVIEATHGGGALAHTSGYSTLLASAPAGALAHIYSNPARSTQAATNEGSTGFAGLLRLLGGAHAANISLVPSASSLTLDADTLASSAADEAGGLLVVDPQSAQALDELPGESWLAIGLGHVGTSIGQDVHGLQALASLGSTLSGGPPESTAGISVTHFESPG